jgi:hypothetical protein
VTADEGTIEVPGGRVWYRSVGEGGTPLLCLHGGPGFTHYYLEPLEALAGRRRVIFYDQGRLPPVLRRAATRVHGPGERLPGPAGRGRLSGLRTRGSV